MSIIRIGIQTRSLRQPVRQALTTAARLGASGVELDAWHELRPNELSQSGLKELRKLLDDRGLNVSAVAFPTRYGFEVPEQLERRVQAAQDAMRLAATLRSNVIILYAGQIPNDTTAQGYRCLIESLTTLAVLGDRIGVRPALQTVGNSPEDYARLLAVLPECAIGIDFHPAGLIAAGASPPMAVEVLGWHVLHVHACDAVRDFATKHAVDVELGRGSAEFPELIGRLCEFDYRGWVTIECPNAADPFTTCENAIAFLKSMA
ncbi:MAG: sugar phosphate isomerase/epimerase [Pirellulales bacterium]|nr:sugar phosphate isomerase/epimerase [Pirellulales bacterium]